MMFYCSATVIVVGGDDVPSALLVDMGGVTGIEATLHDDTQCIIGIVVYAVSSITLW